MIYNMRSLSMVHPVLDVEQVIQKLKAKAYPPWSQYYAFYSSWYGGILKDPKFLLTIPMDDHVVHRGDGVFEAIKSKDRKVYLLDRHLERLKNSAEKIAIKLPMTLSEIKMTIFQTLQVADQSDTLIRLFITRGPGGFSANPYESSESQMYIVITKLNSPSFEKYTKGIKIGKSQVPIKEGWLPQVKSCNYLPNVLMKKESVDRQLEFTVNFEANGLLAESATENIIILDQENILTHPPLEKILKGTTMTRVFELAKNMGLKTAVRPITEKDLLHANEVMMTGTTLDLLGVTQYESHKIGNGTVGPTALSLLKLIQDDMNEGTAF